MRKAITTVFVLLGLALSACSEQISSDKIVVAYDAAGAIQTVGRDSQRPIAELLSIEIIDQTNDLEVQDKSVPAARAAGSGQAVTVAKQSTALKVDYVHEFSVDEGLTSTFTINNTLAKLRCLAIRYRFKVKDEGHELFLAGEGDFEGLPAKGVSTAAYISEQEGKRLVLPLGCIYSKDCGLTFCAEMRPPIASFAISAERKEGSIEVTVIRSRLRVDPNSSRSVTTHFVPHEGDWRPGLDFARRNYPELFTAADGAEKLHVRSISGTSLCSFYRYDGLDEKFWESFVTFSPWEDGFSIPYLHPWFGNYYSARDEWVPFVMRKWHDINEHPEHYPADFLQGKPPADAGWREIVSWIESRQVDDKLFQRFRRTTGMNSMAKIWAKFSHEKVKEFLRLAKKHGHVTMIYWNPSEVWDNWAFDVFKGYEVPGWRWLDCTLCNIHPGSPVDRIYWHNAKAIIDNYADLTGLHIDQAYYAWGDNRHDDGFSVNELGQGFSDLQRNTGRFLRRLSEYARSKGKFTVQNHPNAPIEENGWCDLACMEDRCSPGVGQEYGRYITIGNREGIQLYPLEERLQSNLRNGWFTTMGAVTGASELGDEPRGSIKWRSWFYLPIFDLFKGRSWVLEPDCLELPAGYEGNLFKRPDGNYVATLVSYGESTTTPYWRVGVPITIRISDAEKVKGAYLLSGDQLGPKKISFVRQGNSISVRLPRHRSSSAVLLAVSGRFVSVEPVSFAAAEPHEVCVVLDNFTQEPWTWQGLATYVYDAYQLRANVGAGGTETVGFRATSQRSQASEHGYFLFRIHMDAGSIIPMPEEKARHIATFEVADENGLEAWLAPSMPLVQARLSNSKQGGERPFHEVFPLHIVAGDRATFELGLVNNSAEPVSVQLNYQTQGCKIESAVSQVSLSAGEYTSVPVEVRGSTAGEGEIVATITTGETSKTRKCAFEVFGTSLGQTELDQVKSVSLVADVWGYIRGKEKPVYLNGTAVGGLAKDPIGKVWVKRLRSRLDTAKAKSALKLQNSVQILNPDQESFKVRRVMLEVKTNDGRTFLLRSNGESQSTAKWKRSDHTGKVFFVDWPYREGAMVGLDEAMSFEVPGQG